jgi:hypothetical protein
VIGLLVALQVQGSTVYNTTILYLIQALSYAGNIYFALAGAGWMEHLIKRWQARLDFSIDIFSPALDVPKHIKRRVWEETLSTILLCGVSYHMPPDKVVAFATADEWPPYMLWFQGSAAERHVENIKLLKAIGIDAYRSWVEELRSERAQRWERAIETIQTHFAGPDAYWRPLHPPFPEGVSSFFGKVFLVPFPPTLVMRYDQQAEETHQLQTLAELEAFVAQNESAEVQSRRSVRMALRALDGQQVRAPHVENVAVGGAVRSRPQRRGLDFLARLGTPAEAKRKYTLAMPVAYTAGVLRVHRKSLGSDDADSKPFASGFHVTLDYSDGRRQDPEGITRVRELLVVDASLAIGLHDDFQPTAALLHFLRDNAALVEARVAGVQEALQAYRSSFAAEASAKQAVLSYAFLTDIFDAPGLSLAELRRAFSRAACARVVRELPRRYPASVALLYERMQHLQVSEVHRWWWLYWDDLWRMNAADYPALTKQRTAFSPHFPGSIAYTPMGRRRLEAYLDEHGLWLKQGTKGFFTRGTLNRLYFHLDMLVFARQGSLMTSNPFLDPPPSSSRPVLPGRRSDEAVHLALGTLRSCGDGIELETRRYDTIDASLAPTSRLTGAGTEYDQSDILDRRAWPWTEQRLSGKPGLRPYERAW